MSTLLPSRIALGFWTWLNPDNILPTSITKGLIGCITTPWNTIFEVVWAAAYHRRRVGAGSWRCRCYWRQGWTGIGEWCRVGSRGWRQLNRSFGRGVSWQIYILWSQALLVSWTFSVTNQSFTTGFDIMSTLLPSRIALGFWTWLNPDNILPTSITKGLIGCITTPWNTIFEVVWAAAYHRRRVGAGSWRCRCYWRQGWTGIGEWCRVGSG